MTPGCSRTWSRGRPRGFNAFRPRNHRCLRLTEGSLAHDQRLAILRDALAPTADRGTWRSEQGDSGQDHFATVGTDWLLTYDMSHPHRIRISFRRMRCEVTRISASDGVPLPAWETVADEDTQA